MKQNRILILNGHLLTMDKRLGELPKGDILIENGRIIEISANIVDPEAEKIDAGEFIILPGFVDAHRHMWQTQMRARLANGSLLDYSTEIRSVFGGCYEPEDVYIGILTGYLDGLNAGCTTFIDHCHIMISMEHAEAAINAFRDSGAGGIFCYGMFPNNEPKDFLHHVGTLINPPAYIEENAKKVRAGFFGDNDSQIRFGLALTEYEWLPIGFTTRELKLARELNSHKISIHCGMGSSSQYTHFVDRMAKEKLLDADMHFVHGGSLSQRELRQIADCGASLVSTPETEMQMAMGFPAMERFRRVGGKPSLGIDIVSNQSSDMFTQMRLALQGVRALENKRLARKKLYPQSLTISTQDVLEAATINGAIALHLEDEVGSLTAGKRANLQFIRKNDINMAPVINAVNAVVMSANVGNIDSVMVNGEFLKRGGRLVRKDIPALIEQLEQSSRRLNQKAEAFNIPAIRENCKSLFPLTRGNSIYQHIGAIVLNGSIKPLQKVVINGIIRNYYNKALKELKEK